MGTTAQKLQKLVDNKQLIVDSVNAKAGTSFDINSKLSDVANAIENIESGIDTSDATAIANDILQGKTAYTAEGKVEGTIETYNGENDIGAVGSLKKLLDDVKQSRYLFYDYNGEDVSDLICYNDTENVTNMEYMFGSCYNLITIPLINTSSVTNMQGTFANCTNLTTIPQLDMSKVTNMQNMFNQADGLVYLPPLNTENVTNMQQTFYYCDNLEVIEGLDTSKVTNMRNIFANCPKLRKAPVLNLVKCSDMAYAFQACNSMKVIELLNFNISNSSYTNQAFECGRLRTIIFRSFGTNTTLSSNAFNNAYRLLGTINSTYNPYGTKDCYIYLPNDKIDTLKSATTWSKYADQFRVLEEYTLDGTTSGEFNYNKAMKDYYVMPPLLPFTVYNGRTSTIKIKLNEWETLPIANVTSLTPELATISNVTVTTENIIFDVTTKIGEAIIQVDVNGEHYNSFNFVINTLAVEEPIITVQEKVTNPNNSATNYYMFTLNEDGYYESTNQEKSRSTALCRVYINNPNDFDIRLHFDCIQDSENSDYARLSKVDNSFASGMSSNYVYKSFSSLSSTNIQTVNYSIPSGEHFIDVQFDKDSSFNKGRDSFQFKVRFGGTYYASNIKEI